MGNAVPPTINSPAWTPRTKRTVAIIGFVLLTLAVWQLADILPIVVISMLLAYLLSPLVTFFETRVLTFGPFANKPSRGLATLLTFILVIILFALAIILILPVFAQQFGQFADAIPRLLENLERDVERSLSEPFLFNNEPVLIDGQPLIPLEQIAILTGTDDLGSVLQLSNVNLFDVSRSFVGSMSGRAFGFLGGAFNIIINAIFLLTMMFYLMKDGPTFAGKIVSIAPDHYQGDVRRLLSELAQVWNAYLRGQLILCVVMGTAVFLAAAIMGVPNAPVLGLLSGFLEFVPNLGPALALLPAALLALFSQSSTFPFLEGVSFALAVVVVWTLLQNVEAVILVPRVMGDNLNLHPFVVIVAVIAGASLAGALGVILSAPLVASGRVLLTYIYGKLTDRDPFPPPRVDNLPAQPGIVTRMLRRVQAAIKQRTRARSQTNTEAEA
ncbi:MAG: AI-2E family transporter [Burkholderiales bacterium]|nr:AI-2E family transporter [Anaerolineae bacterium]